MLLKGFTGAFCQGTPATMSSRILDPNVVRRDSEVVAGSPASSTAATPNIGAAEPPSREERLRKRG